MTDASTWHSVRSIRGSFLVPAPTRIASRGLDLVVRDGGGAGTPLLLLHGWGADGLLNFAPAFGPLSRNGWRVITLDLPGHGGSRDTEPFTLERCAYASGLVLDHLELGATVVGGYSLGGPVSQLLARDRPRQISGLIEMATAAHLVPALVMRDSLAVWSRLWSMGAGLGRWPAGLLSRAPAQGGDATNLLSHASWVARNLDHRSLSAAGSELSRYDARPWVGKLGIPAACLVTAKDHVVPYTAQLELASLLGGAVFEVPYGHGACTRDSFGDLLVVAAHSVRQWTSFPQLLGSPAQ